MALKLDTKLIKVADEFADFDILKHKEQNIPHFHTREINSLLILTMQLKGFTRKNIKVEINEDVSRIIMSGEKVVNEDNEMRGFRKAFKLPRGVVMDQVITTFNEDDSELIIRMPTISVIGFGNEEFKIKEIKGESFLQLQVHSDAKLLERDNQEKEQKQHKE